MDQERIQMRKTVAHLAWPIIVQLLLMGAMNIVDTLMLGWYSNTALASVGIAVPVIMAARLILMAIPIGILAMIARAVGEQDPARISNYACTGLWVGLVLGGLVSVFGVHFVHPCMRFFTSNTNLITSASSYLKIVLIAFVFSYLAIISRQIFRAVGDTKTPMYIGLFVNILNIVGNYTLIYGKFGFMRLGVKGAAISTALCAVIEAIIILTILLGKHPKISIKLRDFLRIKLSILKTLFRLSLPAAIEPIITQSGMLIFIKMIASLGELPLATHRILVTIEQISFMPGIGFSIACSAIVGQSLGAKNIDRGKLSRNESIRLALTTMTIFGIFFLLIPKTLISVFTGDNAIIQLGAWCLMITAFAQPTMAYSFIHQGTLRGAGDTQSPMLVAFIGSWIIRIPLTYCLVFTVGLGLYGAWIATTIDWLARAIVYRILYRRGRWQRIKI